MASDNQQLTDKLHALEMLLQREEQLPPQLVSSRGPTRANAGA